MDFIITFTGAITFGPPVQAALSDFDLKKQGHWETGSGPAHFNDAGKKWALDRYSQAVGESLWAIPHNKRQTQKDLTRDIRRSLQKYDKSCNGWHTFLNPCEHGTDIIAYQRVIARSGLSEIDKEQMSIVGAALARDHYYRPAASRVAKLTRKKRRSEARSSAADSKGSQRPITSQKEISRESDRPETQTSSEVTQQTAGSLGRILATAAGTVQDAATTATGMLRSVCPLTS
jgi:hypothetical protein